MIGQADFNSAELLPLLARLVDGALDPDGSRRLEQALARHPEARQLYICYMDLHGELSDRTTPRLAEDPGLRRGLSLRWGLRIAAAAAIVLGFVGTISMLIRNGSEARRQDLGAPVANLVEAEGAVWAADQEGMAPGQPLRPGFVRLISGRARIEFNRGAQVTLQGPCEFGINSAMRGFLRSGKLMAQIPPSAHGFTVGAPGIAVVDLGTRFTMSAGRDGSNVRVLQGRVQVFHEDGRLAGSLGDTDKAYFDPRTTTVRIETPSTSTSPFSYEPFSGYPAGNIHRQPPRADGYAGPWINTRGDDAAAVIEPGLEYERSGVRLRTAGGALRTRGQTGLDKTRLDFDLSGQSPFTRLGYTGGGLIGGPGVEGTLFMSFLLRATPSTRDAFGSLELVAGETPRIDFGQFYNADRFSHVMTFPTPAATAPLDGRVHLFVVRFDFAAGSGSYQLWIDPDLGGGRGQPPTITGSGDLAFDGLRMRSGNGGKPWVFDEIRFGQSWDSVVPTEPSHSSIKPLVRPSSHSERSDS